MTYIGISLVAGTSEAGVSLTSKTDMPQTREYKRKPSKAWLTNSQLHYNPISPPIIFSQVTQLGKMISTLGCRKTTTRIGY
jgi:hypothetical protein